MRRSSEDMSTSSSSSSSEDDTSTAEAGAKARAVSRPRSRPKTADMRRRWCRTEVRKGVKVQRCTACGYTSDRSANVTRHYQRIHELKENKKWECSCGIVFQVKGDLYRHRIKYHQQEPSYTATHVYKMNQKESKPKSVVRSTKSVDRYKEPEFSPISTRVTRSSTRLSSSNHSSNIGYNTLEETISMTTDEPMSTSCSSTLTAESFSSSCSSIEEGASMVSMELLPSSYNSENDENAPPSIAGNPLPTDFTHLPIKKRILSERLFADITNNNVQVQNMEPRESNNNRVRILFRGIDKEKFTQVFREYTCDVLDMVC